MTHICKSCEQYGQRCPQEQCGFDNGNSPFLCLYFFNEVVERLIDVMQTRRKFLFFFLPLLLFAQASYAPLNIIRIGLYENSPLSFTGEDGSPQGFVIGLLDEVARRKQWELDFVPCQWEECLKKLEAGEIDLLSPIAYSEERSKRFDFSEETLLTNWGQVYVQRGDADVSILDLENRTVAVLEDDIHAVELSSLLENFEIDVIFVFYDSYADVMLAIERGDVFAGVVNHFFSLQHAQEYQVKQSTIIFNPIEVRIAATKGKHAALLENLDKEIYRLKSDSNSFYYETLNFWLQDGAVVKDILPAWIFWTAGVAIVFLAFLLGVTRFLQIQIRKKTAELASNQEELTLIMDNIPAMVSYIDREQRYIYADHSYASWYGFAKEEVVGKLIQEILPLENYEKVRPNLEWMIEHGEELHYERRITRYDGETRTVSISYIPHLDNNGKVKAFFATVHDISDKVKNEVALKESEEKYRSLVDNSLVGIYVVQHGAVKFCNQGLADIFGYERAEDMHGILVQQTIAPEDWAFVQKEMQRKETGENPISQYSFEALRLDGSAFNAEILSQAITYNGEPAIQGVLIDITDRVEAEERFRSLSEASSEAIFISEKGICLEQNLAAEKLFGYSLDEAVGRTGTDWVTVEDRDIVMHHMLSGYEEPYTVNALRKDGSVFPCEIIGRMMEYKGRKVLVTVLRDISKQIKAEEGLRESEERYRSIFENSLEGMFRSTLDGRFLMANPALAKIYGYETPEEMISEVTDIREQLYVDGEVRDELINSLKAGRELIDFVEENRRKDGSLIWISTKARTVRDADGEPLYIEGFVEDITERMESDQRLQEREKKLKEAQKIGHMGHWELDLLTDKLTWSDEIYRIFELEPEAFSATYSAFLEKIHPDDREIVAEAFSRSLEDKTSYDITHRLLLADQTVRYVRERCETEYDATGKALRSLGTVQDITEQVQAQQLLEVRAQLTEFSLTHSLDEVLQQTLDEAEKITGSRIGFFHFLNEDQNSLSLQAWSTRTQAEYCEVPNLERHYPVEQAGVWVDCIQTRQPVIHNDYASLEQRKGLPEGHAELKRELVVPVLRSDKIVAILGVGNKPQEYNKKDIEVISTLADLCWEVAERKMAEEALNKSEGFLQQAQEIANLGSYHLDLNSGRWTSSPILDAIFGIDKNYPRNLENWLNLIYSEDQVMMAAYLADEVAEQHKPFDKEYRIRQKHTQEIRWVHGLGKIELDSDGNIISMVGTLQDITEKVLVKTALETYARQLEIVNTITAALSTTLALEDVLGIILQQVVQVIECDSASIFLAEENENLTLVKAVGEAIQFTGISVKLSETLMQGIKMGDKSLVLDDAISSPYFNNWKRPSSIRGWMGIPLYARDTLVGYLTFDSGQPQAFTSLNATLAESFAPQVAQAIYNARLHKEVQQHLQQLQTMNAIATALSTSLELENLLELILNQIEAVVPLDSGAIFLHEDGNVRVAVDRGISPSVKGRIFSDDNELFQEIQKTREPLLVSNAKDDNRFQNWGQSEELASWMGIPLLARDELIGFLTLDRHRGDFLYSKEQALLVKPFAAQAAQAIYNARLYKRVIQDANDLEKHVQKRTEELQNFVELTADREIRMVELKETIRQLRTQLLEAGQTPVADDPLVQ
jgi:PAS domain S-box-containing protein